MLTALGRHWKGALAVTGVALAAALVAATFVWRAVYAPEVAERPPCAACAAALAEAGGEIPTVTVRDLLERGRELDGRLVRVRATVTNDSCAWSLRERGPVGVSLGEVRVAYAADCAACEGTKRNLASLIGSESWYDGSGDVVAVGRLGTISNPEVCTSGARGFEIVCLEEVAPSAGDFYGPWLLRRGSSFGR